MMNNTIYKQSARHTFQADFDKVTKSTINVNDKLYLFEKRELGAYDENGEEMTPYCGRCEVYTTKDNAENLEKIYKFVESHVDAEFYLDTDKATGGLYLQITTWTDAEVLESIENHIFYAFVYELNK